MDLRGCSKLKRKEKIFIVIGVLLTVSVCGGLYVNHQLNRLVSALSRPGLLFVSPDDSFQQNEGLPGRTGIVDPADETALPENKNSEVTQSAPGPGVPAPGVALEDRTGGPSDYEIAAAVQKKIDHPLEKKDLLKAGLLILRKLDSEEIGYLYRVGTKDSYTKEELHRARQILLGKLSPQEIGTLKEIGAKYGKQLRILDPDVQLQ